MRICFVEGICYNIHPLFFIYRLNQYNLLQLLYCINQFVSFQIIIFTTEIYYYSLLFIYYYSLLLLNNTCYYIIVLYILKSKG